MGEKSFSEQVDDIEAELLTATAAMFTGKPHVVVLTAMARIMVSIAIGTDLKTAPRVLSRCAETLSNAATYLTGHNRLDQWKQEGRPN